MKAAAVSPAALLTIRGLSKFFADVPVVDRVSLDVGRGEIVMIVIGAILLLPGLCTLLAIMASISTWNPSDPHNQLVLTIWGVSLAISALGVFLIVRARKRAGRGQ